MLNFEGERGVEEMNKQGVI